MFLDYQSLMGFFFLFWIFVNIIYGHMVNVNIEILNPEIDMFNTFIFKYHIKKIWLPYCIFSFSYSFYFFTS